MFHRFQHNKEKRKTWTSLISKGRSGFTPSDGSRICSNHFKDGQPTTKNPNPTLWLTIQDNRENKVLYKRKSPRKRVFTENVEANKKEAGKKPRENVQEEKNANNFLLPVPMMTEHLNHEFDIKFCTGFDNVNTFKVVFEHLRSKSSQMKYWQGPKKTSCTPNDNKINAILSSPECKNSVVPPLGKRGPERKLSLEQEYLLVLMRLRLGLLIKDLAFHFQVSSTRVSQIWITWIKLMSKELRYLIIWPSKGQVFATLPDAFKKLYPKVRVIIDCTEVYLETPSSLEVQANLWSDYKHHCTSKFLVAITPNGAISWISSTYGGRTSDVYIVRNSGFLDLLEPYNRVMSGRGFKIKSTLTIKRCYLVIPLTAANGTQLCSKGNSTFKMALYPKK